MLHNKKVPYARVSHRNFHNEEEARQVFLLSPVLKSSFLIAQHQWFPLGLPRTLRPKENWGCLKYVLEKRVRAENWRGGLTEDARNHEAIVDSS